MPPSERRSKRLQAARASVPVPTRATRSSARVVVKRKTPEYTSSSSDEEIPDPTVPLINHLPTMHLDPEKNPSPEEIVPKNIKQPISKFIHPALTSSWAINTTMKMCFIFDTTSPTRQFKRGTEDDGSVPFPQHNDTNLSDVTETDAADTSWIQYLPKQYE